MKSRILILAVSAALAASPAYGAWTDTAAVKSAASAWVQVKQTVNTWVDYYWGGSKPAEPAQTATSSSNASQPAGAQSQAGDDPASVGDFTRRAQQGFQNCAFAAEGRISAVVEFSACDRA